GDRLAHWNGPGKQAIPKRLSFEQLRDDERCVRLGADVVDGEDVRMIQPGGSARLLLESMQAIRICRERRWQHLDRDISSQPRIARPIDFAHPAGANRADNLVRTKPGAWLHCGSVQLVPILMAGWADA